MLDGLTIEHCRAWTKHYEVVYHAGVDAGYIKYSNGRKVCDIYREVDGYWHADGFTTGAYSDSVLIALGFILLELNEPWDREIRAAFDNSAGEPVELEGDAKVVLEQDARDY